MSSFYTSYIFCLMKYFYEKPELTTQLYGEVIFLSHPVYKIGTLFEQDGLGLIVVQRRFTAKYVYWDKIDPWLANDIYLHPKFPQYFSEHATNKDYPIIPIRKLMWALRMKPIPKEFWEDYI